MRYALTVQPIASLHPSETVVTVPASAALHPVDYAFRKEKSRLLAFIRKRVPTTDDAEDILQDVFHQLLESFNLLQPIEQVKAWLFRVARNKIIDRYRKRKTESLEGMAAAFEGSDEDGGSLQVLDWMFDANDSPENQYARTLFWDKLTDVLQQLPAEQRDAFVMHELEGRSFKEMAELNGVSINTMLSRKRYAILHLREHLQSLYNELVNP